MNIDDIFTKGVTPKGGENAGKRFRVVNINDSGVTVRDWESGQFSQDMKHGDYKIWEPEKTIFESPELKVTWGCLKKAMEAHNLGDDTEFFLYDRFFGLEEATAKVSTVNRKKAVIIS